MLPPSLLKPCAYLLSLALLAFVVPVALSLAENGEKPETGPVRIGWLGPMTGITAKYAAYQSAILAEEQINAEGGINGRPVKLIYQDGKCQSADAVNAANYLINVAKVRFIVGGHCTSETFPLSAIAERNKVAIVAAITSSPKLTGAGKYISRVTAVNTRGVELMLPYVLAREGVRRFAVLYEETDYAEGLGRYFEQAVQSRGAELVSAEGYAPGETDFRAVLTRLRQKQPDAVYFSVQSPDSMALIRQQMHDLGFAALVLGNEIAGNAAKALGDRSVVFEGLIYAEPKYDIESPRASAFVQQFKSRFGVSELPYGFWTAEAYDAVRLLADTIARCGEDAEKVAACLHTLHSYPGVSGSISINEQGDGVRVYSLKQVVGGKPRVILEE